MPASYIKSIKLQISWSERNPVVSFYEPLYLFWLLVFLFFLLEIDCSNKNYREFDCIEFFQYYHNRRSPDVQIVYHLHVSSLSFIMQLSEHLLCKYPKNPLHKYSFRKSFSASSVTCSVNNIGILKLKWGNKIAK